MRIRTMRFGVGPAGVVAPESISARAPSAGREDRTGARGRNICGPVSGAAK
ncbi:hypothetical protein NRB56_49440 [Nocardia sp. RB56]|uniref:Uncharacterized protein n=1 Tax=Nocardia aurantia TaxID=2585199 RepID=A0A7K0DWZ4_9NOCA|nr:hypothetical protein [Nocardia aurantia]